MNKVIYPLKPCPWCKCSPTLKFYFSRETWRTTIICDSDFCRVNPKGKPENIPKTCKTDLERLKRKMQNLFDNWNISNPTSAKEGKEIDFDMILEEGKRSEEQRKNKNLI